MATAAVCNERRMNIQLNMELIGSQITVSRLAINKITQQMTDASEFVTSCSQQEINTFTSDILHLCIEIDGLEKHFVDIAQKHADCVRRINRLYSDIMNTGYVQLQEDVDAVERASAELVRRIPTVAVRMKNMYDELFNAASKNHPRCCCIQ